MKVVLKFQEGEGSLPSASCEVFVCLFACLYRVFSFLRWLFVSPVPLNLGSCS
jgi:hypothetical protein